MVKGIFGLIMDIILLFFIFGLITGLSKINLRLPSQTYSFLSSYLLLSIGLKGGIEFHKGNPSEIGPQALYVMILGVAIALLAYPILLKLGKLDRTNAASIAAHYGSVSVGTFAAVIGYLQSEGIPFESYVPLFVVLLEVPAIIVGIFLANGKIEKGSFKRILKEAFLGKSIILLIGGLLMGMVATEASVSEVEPFFFLLFKGCLAIFLLEMGQLASEKMYGLKESAPFLILFGVGMPLISALIGTLLGVAMGLSLGGTTILATLAASSSYIAVPAAMKISLPEANPSLSLGASLGITFPFNVVVGIPLYFSLAKLLSL